MVEPIRDLVTIEKIKAILKEWNYKYYIMFVIGINTGLRISDILKLTVEDLYEKTHIDLREQKRNKPIRYLINSQLQKEIKKYCDESNLAPDDYLIWSQKGKKKPLSRNYAYEILIDVAKQIGIESIGTHTMRKTFGYWHYKQFKDIVVLQKIFNHSSPSVTLIYIGITQDEIDETMRQFFI